ncbi:MAG: DNA-directed RNA polymerase subunit delta [Bacilli bacterium]
MNKSQSTLEIAEQILNSSKGSIDIYTLFNKVADIKEFTEEEKETKIGQFYTHLTVDGRFVILPDGKWGLRVDYPFEVVNTISTDFDLFDDEDLSEDDGEEDYDSLDVLVVSDEEEIETEKKNIKTLIGYEEKEEL